MAYIHTVPEPDAKGPLADLYRRFGNPDGTVDQVLKVHSLNPDSLEAHCALYTQSMHRPSPVSRAEREIVGVTVSRINRCAYCLEHHAAGLERLLPDSRKPLAEPLKAGDESALTPRERAMTAYAKKLTQAPATITEADIEPLRDAGLTDREILDVAQAAAYFAYANRIVLGLGAALEPRHAIGQWPETDK
ncbi:MAG: peroxidase-related enzyme [Planctomycetota bacterium]|nr:peroxidase-related enzyme [Planctomycetota bacterium]